jgi:hypothetical protein
VSVRERHAFHFSGRGTAWILSLRGSPSDPAWCRRSMGKVRRLSYPLPGKRTWRFFERSPKRSPTWLRRSFTGNQPDGKAHYLRHHRQIVIVHITSTASGSFVGYMSNSSKYRH